MTNHSKSCPWLFKSVKQINEFESPNMCIKQNGKQM